MGILPLPEDCRKGFIFSSGSGYEIPSALDPRWEVLCVRGPLTAKAYGLDENLAVTDGAVLADKLLPAHEPKTHRCSFIPHHYSLKKFNGWPELCREADIHFIDPVISRNNSVIDIIREIARSELVIAEALHGAILSDSLRIPWIPVRAYNHINLFKWRDYGASVDLLIDPVKIPSIYSHSFLTQKVTEKTRILSPVVKPLLTAAGNLVLNNSKSKVVDTIAMLKIEGRQMISSDSIMAERKAQLHERLEQFRN